MAEAATVPLLRLTRCQRKSTRQRRHCALFDCEQPVSSFAPFGLPSRRRTTLGVLLTASIPLLLAGCGSSGKSTSNAGTSPASSNPTSSGTKAASSGGGGSDAQAAAVDVCSLLTPADAQTIGTKTMLSSGPSITYTLLTEKPEKTSSSSSCTLTIYNKLPDGTSEHEAIVTVTIEAANKLDTISGKKMSGGPGDAAYDDGGFDQVISGPYLLEAAQSQGASRALIDDMYRAMIPRLK